jgi:hypothetical protein
MTFHNLRAFGDPRAISHSETFDARLRDTMSRDPAARNHGLMAWASAPRRAHRPFA